MKITRLLLIFIEFYLVDLPIDKSIKIGKLHQKLHRRYFKRAAGLDREKLGAYKPDEDFKPGFEEKIRFFRFF